MDEKPRRTTDVSATKSKQIIACVTSGALSPPVVCNPQKCVHLYDSNKWLAPQSGQPRTTELLKDSDAVKCVRNDADKLTEGPLATLDLVFDSSDNTPEAYLNI
ncbi:hypothetical protein T265_01359 [Opisthorchis viverrini]|uniref:Uncharacterized protein n=1 Tax=Opisthorchis viverrini TaxID=6198 RepID=A0A075AJ32_OPIVI|nr:hypothetical protein T265_01359 [Opisthorchis viverrini]KER32679.1 hypothetical protein T265_01359 [Opisthorchis viverrini]